MLGVTSWPKAYIGRCMFLRAKIRSYSQLLNDEPLRIAFFGSDDFTVSTLGALNKYKESKPDHIERLDVVAKSPKKKHSKKKRTLNIPPPMKYALDNDMSLAFADSRNDIIKFVKSDYNMAIAVSYGQLIPEEFLASLKYGGLNVHPSLLPSLQGAAPIHWALLNNYMSTGTTVQTLHPTKFDAGRILYHSEETPIDRGETVESLAAKLKPLSADALVKVISDKLYLDPNHEAPTSKNYQPSFAPKILSKHKRIVFEVDTLPEILAKYNVFDTLHVFQKVKDVQGKKNSRKRAAAMITTKRLSLHEVEDASLEFPFVESELDLDLGEYTFLLNESSKNYDNNETPLRMVIRVIGGYISAKYIIFEGYQSAQNAFRFRQNLAKRGAWNQQLIVDEGQCSMCTRIIEEI